MIETLVSAAILVILIGVMAQMQVGQSQMQRKMKNLQAKLDYIEDIKEDFSYYSTCSEILATSLQAKGVTNNDLKDNLNPLSTNSSLSGEVNKDFFNKRWSVNKDNLAKDTIQLNSVSFSLSKEAIDPLNPDPVQMSLVKEQTNYTLLKGFYRFKFSVNNKIASDIELRDFEIPITAIIKHVPGDKTFSVQTGDYYTNKNISCIQDDSDLVNQVAEACEYYGGTLTKGLSCEYQRVLREHRPNAADASVPLGNMKAYNEKTLERTEVKRMPFADVLCYLDMLTVRIPNQDPNDPERQPSNDRFNFNQATTFCKRPGVVVAANEVDVSSINDTSSPDVADIFTEDGMVRVVPVFDKVVECNVCKGKGPSVCAKTNYICTYTSGKKITQVTVRKQYNSVRCEFGKTFGIDPVDPRALRVWGGCRATFNIYR